MTPGWQPDESITHTLTQFKMKLNRICQNLLMKVETNNADELA